MFEHENALTGIDQAQLPRTIKSKIIRFNQQKNTLYKDPAKVDKEKELALIAYSAVIADNIQDWTEKDLPDAVEVKEPEIKEEVVVVEEETIVEPVVVNNPPPTPKKSGLSTIFGR